MRPPKPVRAWATMSLLTGQINRCTDATRAECIDTCGFVGETDYKPVRVTIVPDGTPSQAAEVRKLRRLLRIALCAAENYIAAMEPHEGECDEPEDQAVIWHARKHVAEVKAALRGRRGAK